VVGQVIDGECAAQHVVLDPGQEGDPKAALSSTNRRRKRLRLYLDPGPVKRRLYGLALKTNLYLGRLMLEAHLERLVAAVETLRRTS
jgi:hypothetical protein